MLPAIRSLSCKKHTFNREARHRYSFKQYKGLGEHSGKLRLRINL